MSVMVLGRSLLSAGILDASSFEMRVPRARSAVELLENLIRDGLVTENTLVTELARELNVPRFDPRVRSPEPEAVALLSRRSREELRVLPVALRGGGSLLWVATCNPLDEGPLEEVAQLTGRRVRPVLIGPRELTAALQQLSEVETGRHDPAPASRAPLPGSSEQTFPGEEAPQATPGPHAVMPPGVATPAMPISGVPPQAAYGYPPAAFLQFTPPPGALPFPVQQYPANGGNLGVDVAKLQEELAQTKVIVRVLTQLLVERGALDAEELKSRLRAERDRKAREAAGGA